jgi:hypothetical protein
MASLVDRIKDQATDQDYHRQASHRGALLALGLHAFGQMKKIPSMAILHAPGKDEGVQIRMRSSSNAIDKSHLRCGR